MKYIKTYENKTWKKELDEALENFYNDFNDKKDTFPVLLINFPMVFKDEYKMLYFYYNGYNPANRYYNGYNPANRYYHSNTYEEELKMKYIKKKIKEKAIESIILKIEKNVTLYTTLKDYLIKYPVNIIRDAKNKYIMFTFNTALKKIPDYIKNSLKYNL
jgi:hypothetical protein